MSQKKVRLLHRLYGILLTVLLVALGACMILFCVSIYVTGDSPFTRERVGAYFSLIAIPVWLGLAMVLGGIALQIFLPLEPSKLMPRRSASTVLRKTVSAYDMRTVPYGTQERLFLLRRRRKRIKIWAGILMALSALPALIWCFLPKSFAGANKTGEVMLATLVVLGSTIVALGILLISTVLYDRACIRETDIVRGMIADRTVKRTTVRRRLHYCDWRLPFSIRLRFEWPTFWITWGVRGAILLVALVFLIVGIVNGGMADVLGKAVRICTECIGLG